MDDNTLNQLNDIRRWARKAFPLGEGSLGFKTRAVSVKRNPSGDYELLLKVHNLRANKSAMMIATFTAKHWQDNPDNIVHQTWTNLIARLLAEAIGVKMD